MRIRWNNLILLAFMLLGTWFGFTHRHELADIVREISDATYSIAPPRGRASGFLTLAIVLLMAVVLVRLLRERGKARAGGDS